MTHQVRRQNGSKPTPTASPDTNGTRSQNTGNSVRWLSETLFDALQKEGVLLVVCSSDNVPPYQRCRSSTWILVHCEAKAFSCYQFLWWHTMVIGKCFQHPKVTASMPHFKHGMGTGGMTQCARVLAAWHPQKKPGLASHGRRMETGLLGLVGH